MDADTITARKNAHRGIYWHNLVAWSGYPAWYADDREKAWFWKCHAGGNSFKVMRCFIAQIIARQELTFDLL